MKTNKEGMESKTYIITAYDSELADALSIRIAEAGNTVLYMTDNSAQGYAIAAEEPRVRFRFCPFLSHDAIEKEIIWAETFISKAQAVVVVMGQEEMEKAIQDKQWPHFPFAFLENREEERKIAVCYVVTSNKDALGSLFMKCCQFSFSAPINPAFKINTFVIEQPKSRYSNQVIFNLSELITYLSSHQAVPTSPQIFYFRDRE